MSGSVGPIFIHDAEGTPLMPVAARHARKLVQAGKALALTHQYPFSVLRLKRRVKHPVLKPILLSLHIHQNTCELFVVVQAARTVLPLLAILLDLSVEDGNTELRGAATALPLTEQQLLAPQYITSVLYTLVGLLPVSHILVNGDDCAWHWGAFAHLLETLQGCVAPDHVVARAEDTHILPGALLSALEQFQAEPAHYALAVATRIAAPGLHFSLEQSRRHRYDASSHVSSFDVLASNQDPATPAIRRGMLCQSGDSRNPEVGIVAFQNDETHETTVAILTSASVNAVSWQPIVCATDTIHVLNRNPVVFVPVAPNAQRQHLHVLEDEQPAGNM